MYIPSSLYGLDASVYSLPLCLCGCSMCVWGRDWVTGLSGCVTGCVYLVQDKVMGIQGSLRLRSQTGWRPAITDSSVVLVDAGEVM